MRLLTSRNVQYEQLAAFVSTIQLLASYICVKSYPGMLNILAVVVKTEDAEEVVSICHESSVGIELRVCLVRNN